MAELEFTPRQQTAEDQIIDSDDKIEKCSHNVDVSERE